MIGALSKARGAGFTVRLIDGEKIGITPLERLTDTQKHWLSEHRDDVLAELRCELANESANVEINLRSRWELFVSLATQHDVTTDEIEARFTTDDIAALLTETIEKLPAHAQTIAEAIHRSRTPQEQLKRDIAASDMPYLIKAIHRVKQTCGECCHFQRIAHPNLGTCRVKAQPEAPCGLWDTDQRNYCYQWEAVP